MLARRTPDRGRLHQGSPDLALAIRPRYADHRHLSYAAPPAKARTARHHASPAVQTGCLTARLYGRACKLVVQAGESCPRLLVYRLPGQDTGLAGQPDDPLDLVGQAEGFGVADGAGQHGLGGVLVSGPGEHFSGGDPLSAG